VRGGVSEEKLSKIKDAPPTMLAPLMIMVILIILFGIWPQPLLAVLEKASTIFLGGLTA